MIFNGTYTLINTEAGTHRTFKIHTQPADATFQPNGRIISLLTGSDNEHDYTGIGFVTNNGIKVWSKKKGTEFEKLAKFFETVVTTNRYSGRVKVELSKKCLVCNRELTTPESIEEGIGTVCKKRTF